MRFLLLVMAMTLAVTGAGCTQPPEQQPAPSSMAVQRQAAINDVHADQVICAECENIKFKRETLDKPGVIGYVAFLSQTGVPVLYSTTLGKCTSSGKRLEDNYDYARDENGNLLTENVGGNEGYSTYRIVQGASEDGSRGQSDAYIYCKTTDGSYIQWNGPYLFSNRPIQLTIKPLAIAMAPTVNAVHGQ